MFTSEEEIPTIKQAYRDCGLKPHQTLIWKKHRIGFGGSDYQHTYEPFVYGWTGHKERYMINQRNLSDVWEFARPSTSELHPTMKPIDLIVYALANSSKQDDIVLDLFLGSGSTLIASEKTGRICYGMEIDPKYVDVIVQRYVDYTGDAKVRRNGKEITWQK
jgi:DNA modification methylase